MDAFIAAWLDELSAMDALRLCAASGSAREALGADEVAAAAFAAESEIFFSTGDEDEKTFSSSPYPSPLSPSSSKVSTSSLPFCTRLCGKCGMTQTHCGES